MKESKCEHCGNWTDGNATHCSYCGGMLKEDYIKEREALKAQSPTGLPFIVIPDDDPWYKKSGKYVVKFGQIIFFTIISFIAAMASSTVH